MTLPKENRWINSDTNIVSLQRLLDERESIAEPSAITMDIAHMRGRAIHCDEYRIGR
jgi:hypothetical protein